MRIRRTRGTWSKALLMRPSIATASSSKKKLSADFADYTDREKAVATKRHKKHKPESPDLLLCLCEEPTTDEHGFTQITKQRTSLCLVRVNPCSSVADFLSYLRLSVVNSRKRRINAPQQGLKRPRVERRNRQGFVFITQRNLSYHRVNRRRIQQIRLVKDQQARNLIEFQLSQNRFDGSNLLLPTWVGGVNQMDQQAAAGDLFERRAKRGEQIRWQIAYEAHRVVDNHFAIAREPQAARRRIERGEHSLFCNYRARRECVQQGRFACVRIADNGNDRQSITQTFLAALLPAQTLRREFLFQAVNPIAHATAIGFQLCLAGTTPADPAGQARERRFLSHD